MPRQYEAIRDKFISRGMGTAESKTLASKIFNAHRKPSVAPVGPHSDKKLSIPPRQPKYKGV